MNSLDNKKFIEEQKNLFPGIWNDEERLFANLTNLLDIFYEFCHINLPLKPGNVLAERRRLIDEVPSLGRLLYALAKLLDDNAYSGAPSGYLIPGHEHKLKWIRENYSYYTDHPGSSYFYRCKEYKNINRTGAIPARGRDPELVASEGEPLTPDESQFLAAYRATKKATEQCGTPSSK